MSVQDLVFKISSSPIRSPQLVDTSATVVITVQNMGSEALTDLGVYLTTASSLGDLDNASDNPPATDYQDVMTWGEGSEGIQLTVQTDQASPTPATTTVYVDRSMGNSVDNKIACADLSAQGDGSDTLEITIDLQSVTGILTRRAYIDLVVE